MRAAGDPTWSAIFPFACLLLSLPLAPAPPRDPEFFGADDSRIREPPKCLKVCHRSEENVDECIKASLEKFLECVNSGSPQPNLPDVDPVEIPLVEFRQGYGNVSLHVTLEDLVVVGLKRFRILRVKSDLMEDKLEISMDSPSLLMSAEFSAEGGVYTFPISARGDFSMNLTDVSAVLILRLARTKLLPGLDFFAVDSCLLDLLPKDIDAHFGEFVDGSNKIGSAFNSFFNRNAHEIFTVIKPKFSEVLADVFGAIANDILSRHPEDVLLPP